MGIIVTKRDSIKIEVILIFNKGILMLDDRIAYYLSFQINSK